MPVNSISQTGLQGIQTGLALAEDAANRIAQPQLGEGLDKITEAVVDLKIAELQVKASAKVVKTANEIAGTLIDVLA